MRLFPQPQYCKTFSRLIDMRTHTYITLPTTLSDTLCKRVREISLQLETKLKRPLHLTKAELPQGEHNTQCDSIKYIPPERKNLMVLHVDTNIPKDGFTLTLDTDGFNLRASTEAGLYYAVTVAAQLLQDGDCVRKIHIRDFPDLEHRGIMLDVSRDKVPTMKTLRYLIDTFANMRINQLQLYIEHTFAFSGHKKVWQHASPFTPEEIIELDIYCRERFIELVPNLNSFGHLERWLQHPEYKHLALRDTGFIDPWGTYRPVGSTLKPTQQSIDFIQGLYQEYLPLFKSSFFNVGCDETFEIESTATYIRHLKKIHRTVTKQKKRMMFWGDIILQKPDMLPHIPTDCIALDWGYEANSPFAKTTAIFAQSGLDFYVCPGTSSWNSITGRSTNCIKNIENATKHGVKNNALGILITDWGDNGHHQSLPVSFLGYCVGAAFGWCLKKNKKNNWGEIIDQLFFSHPQAGLGPLWVALGTCIDNAPSSININKTFINTLFFTTDVKKVMAENSLTLKTIRICLKHLAHIEKKAHTITQHNQHIAQAHDELLLSIAMARMALERCIHPQQNIQESKRIKKRFRQLWKKRNRPGGLQDSLARIT